MQSWLRHRFNVCTANVGDRLLLTTTGRHRATLNTSGLWGILNEVRIADIDMSLDAIAHSSVVD